MTSSRKTKYRYSIWLILIYLFGIVPAETVWEKARPGYVWNFPQDHWARRDYRNEWWYFTGHLESKDSQKYRFAYQMTFFRVGLRPGSPNLDSNWGSRSILMGHAAISDLESNRHLFSEVLYRESPLLGEFSEFPDPLLAWSIGPPGTKGPWKLSWNGEAFDFEMADDSQNYHFQLSTSPLKPRIFQGPNGYSQKSDYEDNASLYYSFTRLLTTGRILLDGSVYDVTGMSWMDKEFSSGALTENQVGWDWLSLQLENNTEFMIAQLRNREQETDYSWANQIRASGEVIHFEGEDIKITPVKYWLSTQTEARYPIEWQIELPDHSFIVKAEFEDQENRSSLYPGINYWEGAIRAEDETGKKIGQGFLEMTGYGKSIRLPL
jgi:predicted secreted hydrolase